MYKYIIGLMMFAGLVTSCNTDNIGGVYTPTAQNISFVSDEAVNTLTSESEIEVTVSLLRNITKGEYTAHYTLTSEQEGVFTDLNGGTVTFADGSAKAYVTLKLNGMEKGNEYKATLTLSDADIETADENIGKPTVITNVTVMCDYEWVPAGTCTFYDNTIDESTLTAEGVSVENALGTNLYRLVDAYKSIPDAGLLDSGLSFTLNDDGSFDIVRDAAGVITKLSLNGSVFPIVWIDQYAPTYCNTIVEGNIYTTNALLVVGEDFYLASFSFEWDKDK